MASSILDGADRGALLEDHENAIWDMEKSDFPITLYDRPSLAFSNLLLRGDIDAATRAMFTPQSLTPSEMKTLSGTLRGGNKDSKILKTITDIATNPLVWLGVVMAFKYPLGNQSEAFMRASKGLLKGKTPRYLTQQVSSAFTNLRNVPGALRNLMRWGRDTANMKEEFGMLFNKPFTVLNRAATKDELHQVSAWIQGFHKIPKAKVLDKAGKVISRGDLLHGTRKSVYSVYEIRKNQALWPDLEKQMKPEILKLAKGIRASSDSMWNIVSKDKKAFSLFKAEMKSKGINIGEEIADHFPAYSKFSTLEAEALQGRHLTGKQYSKGIEGMLGMFGAKVSVAGKIIAPSKEKVAGSLKAAQGFSVGQLSQLRKWEKMGMPPIVDDILTEVNKNTNKMVTILEQQWANVSGMTNSGARADAFADRMMAVTRAKNLNTKLRLGPGEMARDVFVGVGEKLGQEAGSPKFFDRIKNVAAVLAEPAQYDIGVMSAYGRYIPSMSSSYTWHLGPANGIGIDGVKNVAAKGWKNIITPVIKNIPENTWEAAYMQDQLVPMMRGMKPHKAFLRASAFGEYKNMARTWLRNHPAPKALLGEGGMGYLDKYFGDFGSLSAESLGAKISHHFYLSTLGLNISPASKNLLQNFLTTVHVPGITKQGMATGMKEMTKRVGTYTKLLGQGKETQVAFESAFDDYVKTIGKGSGTARAILGGGDILQEGQLLPKVATLWDKAKSGMMAPFATSESFNRLSGFYMGKHSILKTAGETAANEFGMMVNHVAHFPGGPIGMPKALLGAWSPVRQFMHFPLRYMDFLTASTQYGTGLGKLRTPAVALGASAAAYSGAKNLLGIDISAGLAAGALPVPQFESSPFYPFPLVPPIAAVAGAAVTSLASGEADDAKRAAWLLAPGGLAIRRLYKTLGPKSADYKNPTEDGRIPVYNDKKALVGAFSPWQLFMKSIGLTPTSQQAEYGAAKWMMTQRDKIRAYRRNYLEELTNNNLEEAERIQAQFQKAYPEVGPLTVKKTDIKAVHNRREVSRLNRILKGFPKEFQPLMSHMISQAGLSTITKDLEASPLGIDIYNPSTALR